MVERILLDTNIIIHYVQGDDVFVNYLDKKIFDYAVLFVSTITITELYSKSDITKNEADLIDEFLSRVNIIYVDSQIAKTAGFLRRISKIKTPDAIIAATAICSNIILATENDKDFINIEELKLGKII